MKKSKITIAIITSKREGILITLKIPQFFSEAKSAKETGVTNTKNLIITVFRKERERLLPHLFFVFAVLFLSGK